MNRRALLLAMPALAAAPGPGSSVAQNHGNARRVGYLVATRDSDFPMLHDALRRGLRDLGFVDGQNIEIVVRSAEGSVDRYSALVAELVQQGVDVIFTGNTPAAVAAKAGAPATPVVFAGVGDPVGSKLSSLRRPAGNATGLALVVNRKTARAIALEVPQTILVRADQVIE